MITRIAPTPSGFIHTGNVFNFLLNWLWARSNRGKVLLRIDDGDAQRKRTEYVEDIFRVLEWLELEWDLGPSGPEDFEKNWSQSTRHELYFSVLNELKNKNLLFACNCSRNNKLLDTESMQCLCVDKKYDLLQPGLSWKFKVPEKISVRVIDKHQGNLTMSIPADDRSFIVKRKDNIPAYQICSLMDDRHFGVTHICRGNDLLPSSAIQVYLDNQLEIPHLQNCTFWHHPLISAADGVKLSKSAGACGVSIRHTISKQQLIQSFAQWMGFHNGTVMSLKDMMHEDIFKV